MMRKKANAEPNGNIFPNEQVVGKEWEVNSKEFAIDIDGNLKISKVVYQLKREFTLKVISAIAVFVAFIGLIVNSFNQVSPNRLQISQQKSMVQIGIYTKCIVNLNTLSDKGKADSAFVTAQKKLRFENLPEIMLLGDPVLIKDIKSQGDEVMLYRYLSDLNDTTIHVNNLISDVERDTFGNEISLKKLSSYYNDIYTQYMFINKTRVELDSIQINRALNLIQGAAYRFKDLELLYSKISGYFINVDITLYSASKSTERAKNILNQDSKDVFDTLDNTSIKYLNKLRNSSHKAIDSLNKKILYRMAENNLFLNKD